MGTFSTGMRATSKRLITKLGSPCILTKVTEGAYSPTTGKTNEAREDFNVHSAPAKTVSEQFGQTGTNTNLNGFETEDVTVYWFGQVIDKSWLYNGENITKIKSTEAQGDIIIYILSIASD